MEDALKEFNEALAKLNEQLLVTIASSEKVVETLQELLKTND